MKHPKYILKDQVKALLRSVGYRLVPERAIEQYANRKTDSYFKAYDQADKLANPAHDRAGDDFSKERRFYTLWQAAGEVLRQNISGDFVECGSKHGHSAMIMADQLLKHDSSERLMWVFDSFEGGLSDKNKEDRSTDLGDTSTHKTKRQKERFSSSYEHVKKLFAKYDFVKIVKGWIPDTLVGEPENRQYALVHIDVDLYEPTKAALEFFYERMEEGGMIVVDDYGSATFPGCQKAVDQFLDKNPHRLFIVSHTLGCIILK